MNFFLENLNTLIHSNFNYYNIVLPLGISFFTFTQIAFLVDAYHEKINKFKFIDFSLFVTYFPHLIAGPIIHHGDVMPQFRKLLLSKQFPVMRYLIIGLSIFALGLFKKVCIADTLAPKVDYIFLLPGKGYDLSMLDAWVGAIGYTLQLYFDFSGYSDMAIGLSYMIGIKLPINFFSPYKAINIIDFWRRWHMSLSRFFRDYLYIPLGGSRRGPFRKYLNILTVMIIVGFWHGAGWTFILWGTYHGLLLVINHSWQAFYAKYVKKLSFTSQPKFISNFIKYSTQITTFICVVIGWVMFRASDFSTAQNFYAGMFHYHRYYYGSSGLLTILNYIFFGLFLIVCLSISIALPNTMVIMRSTRAYLGSSSIVNSFAHVGARTRLEWSPSFWYGLPIGVLLYLAIASISGSPTSFLYFNF